MSRETKERSLRWMVISLSLLVAFFGWGFLAGSYEGAHATPLSEMDGAEVEVVHLRRGSGGVAGVVMVLSSVLFFLLNAVTQLPKLPDVLMWHLSNRLWMPILILVVEMGVIGGGYALQRLETSLSGPPAKPRKRHKLDPEAQTPLKKRRKKKRTLGDGYGVGNDSL